MKKSPCQKLTLNMWHSCKSAKTQLEKDERFLLTDKLNKVIQPMRTMSRQARQPTYLKLCEKKTSQFWEPSQTNHETSRSEEPAPKWLDQKPTWLIICWTSQRKTLWLYNRHNKQRQICATTKLENQTRFTDEDSNDLQETTAKKRICFSTLWR
jgi:hypothetical protein